MIKKVFTLIKSCISQSIEGVTVLHSPLKDNPFHQVSPVTEMPSLRSHDQGFTGFSVMQVNAEILSMRRKILSVSRITLTLWSSSFCAAFIISCRWAGLSSAQQYTNSYPEIANVLIKPVTGVKVVCYEGTRISLFFTNHLHNRDT